MIYTGNESLRRAVKDAAARRGLSLAAIARSMDKIPQELNNTLIKKNISFNDIARIADALKCNLVFDIVPQDQEDIDNTI